MPRTYEQATGKRRSRLGPDAEAQGEVVARAYGIAMQVVALREQHGLTQAQLAEKCDMDQADISRIERGATSPTARTLQRIAAALGADVRLVAHPS